MGSCIHVDSRHTCTYICVPHVSDLWIVVVLHVRFSTAGDATLEHLLYPGHKVDVLMGKSHRKYALRRRERDIYALFTVCVCVCVYVCVCVHISSLFI